MRWWHVAAAADLTLLLVFVTIALLVGRRLCQARERFRDNPLGWALVVIFGSSGIRHGEHLSHLALPALGFRPHLGVHAQQLYGDPTLNVWHLVSAAAGLVYIVIRRRSPAKLHGSTIYDDAQMRQQQALEIHDSIVQGLATAKISFEAGLPEHGMAALDRTLKESRTMITSLAGGGSSGALQAGKLRRSSAAGTGEPTGSGVDAPAPVRGMPA